MAATRSDMRRFGRFGDGLRSRGWLLLLLLLLGAWYLTPIALQGASCSKRDTALCHDHGNGVLRKGRDHVVCVYADRVVKTVPAYVETQDPGLRDRPAIFKSLRSPAGQV